MPVATCLTVAVCGGGAAAHFTLACLGAKRHLRVNVLTRRPQDWNANRTVTLATAGTSWESEGDVVGKFAAVSSDAAVVIPAADIVLVCVPANAQSEVLRRVAPHIKSGAMLGSIFGEGGFDWVAREALGDRFEEIDVLFAMQNIPWVCRVRQYGHEAALHAPKQQIRIATSPPHRCRDTARLVAVLFDMPCATLPNFISVTLCPSNQIIHPGRYYGIFHEWDGQSSYRAEEVAAGLYRDMDEFSAKCIQRLDDDLQCIRRALAARFPDLDLSHVPPLVDRIILDYADDVSDKSSLQQVIRTNRGYAKINTPVEEAPGGGVWPAVSSRLFWEDVPFGLCVMKGVAELLEIEVPAVVEMIRWHQGWMGVEFVQPDGLLNPATVGQTGAPARHGIDSPEALVACSMPSSSADTPRSATPGSCPAV